MKIHYSDPNGAPISVDLDRCRPPTERSETQVAASPYIRSPSRFFASPSLCLLVFLRPWPDSSPPCVYHTIMSLIRAATPLCSCGHLLSLPFFYTTAPCLLSAWTPWPKLPSPITGLAPAGPPERFPFLGPGLNPSTSRPIPGSTPGHTLGD